MLDGFVDKRNLNNPTFTNVVSYVNPELVNLLGSPITGCAPVVSDDMLIVFCFVALWVVQYASPETETGHGLSKKTLRLEVFTNRTTPKNVPAGTLPEFSPTKIALPIMDETISTLLTVAT